MANVLSTTVRAPRSAAKAATAAMSMIDSSGLDGVSIHTIFVFGIQAAARLSSEVRSAHS